MIDKTGKEKYLIDPFTENQTSVDKMITTILTGMQFSMLRAAHHMTQKDVQKLTGLSTQSISDIEHMSRGNPTYKSMMRYLDVFGYELAIKKKEV